MMDLYKITDNGAGIERFSGSLIRDHDSEGRLVRIVANPTDGDLLAEGYLPLATSPEPRDGYVLHLLGYEVSGSQIVPLYEEIPVPQEEEEGEDEENEEPLTD